MTEVKKESLSAKEIMAIAKEYLVEVLKYSWLIAIAVVVLGRIMYNRKVAQPTVYTAVFSFAFNEAVSENKNSIASLFGGGGSFFINADGESTLSFAKLEEIVKTRKIILNVLFHKSTLKNSPEYKNDFIINHYLRNFYYPKYPNIEKFYFTTDSIDYYDSKSNYLIQFVHNSIIKNHLILDPASHIMHLKVTSNSEDFSYELAVAFYSEIAKHYDIESTEQKKRFYEMALKRTEELRDKLGEAEANYISYVNSNGAESGGRNNIMIKTQFLSTNLSNATEAYFAALKTTEAAWVTYESQRQIPTTIVVDPPLYPLAADVPNPSLHMILGGILGGGLVFVGIIVRKFLRDFFRKDTTKTEEEELILKKETEKLV